MNVLQAMDDRDLFARWFDGEETWGAWRAFLSTLFGLPMTEEQRSLYSTCTGRNGAPETPFSEAWLICGRRAGKSFVLALIAVFLAVFRDYRPYLSPGERAMILVIATDRRQARVIFRYIRAFLAETPTLAVMIERETAEVLDLNNGVTIEVATASFRRVRGYTLAAALLDELAFWPTEESASPDTEVIASLRPAMATIPGAMLLCASSPYARRGAMWDAYQRWFGQDTSAALVWKASTRTMNPGVPQAFVDAETERDPANARAEYGAEFRSDIEAFLSREAIQACVDTGATERPYDRQWRYYGFTDPAGGGGDSFTLGIAHKQADTVVLDVVREVQPSEGVFNPEAIVGEFAALLRAYRITTVAGDRYAGSWPTAMFRKFGIGYVPSERSKSEIYLDFAPLVLSGGVALLDHQRGLRQLAALERRTTRGGRDSVDHPPGAGHHDDVANCIAGAVLAASRGVAGMQHQGEVIRQSAPIRSPFAAVRNSSRTTPMRGPFQ